MASRRTVNRNTPHPAELRFTLMSYVAHYWATPHPVELSRNLTRIRCTYWATPYPYWSMPHHNEQRHTLLSYPAHYWATLHLTELRSTLLSFAALFRLLYILWSGRFLHLLSIFLLGFWIFYFCDSSLHHNKWTSVAHFTYYVLSACNNRQAFYSFTYVSIVLSWEVFSNILSTSLLDFLVWIFMLCTSVSSLVFIKFHRYFFNFTLFLFYARWSRTPLLSLTFLVLTKLTHLIEICFLKSARFLLRLSSHIPKPWNGTLLRMNITVK